MLGNFTRISSGFVGAIERLGGFVCEGMDNTARMPVIECMGYTMFNPHFDADSPRTPIPHTPSERRTVGAIAIGLLLLGLIMTLVVPPLNARSSENNPARTSRP